MRIEAARGSTLTHNDMNAVGGQLLFAHCQIVGRDTKDLRGEFSETRIARNWRLLLL
jgi:hypothetical protein